MVSKSRQHPINYLTQSTDILVNSIFGDLGGPKSTEKWGALRDRLRSPASSWRYEIHWGERDDDDTEPCPLGFSENFGVVQFGNDLYSLGLLVQFRIDLCYFLKNISEENKNTATRRHPTSDSCPQHLQTDFWNSHAKRSKTTMQKAKFSKNHKNPNNSQTVQTRAKLYNCLFLQQYLQMDAD